jgi:hypothetical protein
MALSQTTKRWYRSKTVWFNILTIGGAVLDGLLGLLPTVQPLVDPTVYPWVMLSVGAVNVVLRAITTGPIDWEGDDV